ncbi:Uma2 family endonuclease [bacterium]|nr:Uma2 family endonuclease [bacterium]MCI0601647.1 Uma2 family endonuclease [bacterium]
MGGTPSRAREITSEELLRIPRDGFRYELVEGILKKMSPTGGKHGKVTVRITTPLAQHVQAHDLGQVYAAETGFKIASNPDTVLAPDVAFVSQNRVEKMGDVEGFIPGPPDLAVEVASPSDLFSETEEKELRWLEAGSRMVIVADPRKKTITAYRSRYDIKVLKEGDILDCEDIIPGYKLSLKGIFD